MPEIRRLLIFFISLLFSLAASPTFSETTIRIGSPGALTAAIPIYLGARKGIFARYGLNAEVIATRNEQMNMQALASESVQFLTASSTGLFYLGRQGGDVIAIASWNNSSPYSLVSRFKIRELSELKGKKLATSGAGGRADAFMRFMLVKAGLDPKKDAQIMPLSGGSSLRLAALVSGNIDATLISPLQGKSAEKLGLTVIPIPLEYIQGIVITRRTFLEKNREIVRAFLRGLAQSVRELMADKENTIGVMSRVLRINDKETLEYSYQTLRSEARPDLLPTEESIANVLKTMSYEDSSFASIPPFKYFDLSILEEIKAGVR